MPKVKGKTLCLTSVFNPAKPIFPCVSSPKLGLYEDFFAFGPRPCSVDICGIITSYEQPIAFESSK